MKCITHQAAQLAIAFGFAVAVKCDDFTYSYVFQSSDHYLLYGSHAHGAIQTASGTFSGTANGNLITDISNITVSFNGIPVGGYFYQGGWLGHSITDYKSGAAVVSFDGSQNNFFFVNADYFNGDYSDTAALQSVVNFSDHNFFEGFWKQLDLGPLSEDDPINSSWRVVDLTTGVSTPGPGGGTSMADGGGTLTLLGIAFAGVVLRNLRESRNSPPPQ